MSIRAQQDQPPPPPLPPPLRARSTNNKEFSSVVQQVMTSTHQAPFSRGHVFWRDRNHTTLVTAFTANSARAETFERMRGKINYVKAWNVEGIKRELFSMPGLGREPVLLQQPASWILHLSAWWKPLLQSGTTALWRASLSTARTECTYCKTSFTNLISLLNDKLKTLSHFHHHVS